MVEMGVERWLWLACGERARGQAGSLRAAGKLRRGPGMMEQGAQDGVVAGRWGPFRQSGDYFPDQGDSRAREP